jgi:hypothetical protein
MTEYQGKENQSYIEILSHLSQNGCHQENEQVLVSIQGKEPTHPVPVNVN